MKNLINQKKRKKSQITEDPNPFLNYSPNLLNQAYSELNIIEANQEKFLKWLKYPIFLLQLGFIVVLLLNVYVNAKLTGSADQVIQLESQLLTKSSAYSRIRILSSQINIYKQAQNDKLLFSESISQVLSAIPPTVTISKASYSKEQAQFSKLITLDLTANDALSVAYLISNVLSIDEVDHVQINNATFMSRQNVFEVSLGIEFK